MLERSPDTLPRLKASTWAALRLWLEDLDTRGAFSMIPKDDLPLTPAQEKDWLEVEHEALVVDGLLAPSASRPWQKDA